MSNEKKVWVINLNTNVKYEIGEEWFLNNTNDFALTQAPAVEEEVVKVVKKAKPVKKAKVVKKVLKASTEDKE